MQIEEWAVRNKIEEDSDNVQHSLTRWSKYDLLRLRQELDSSFEYLAEHAHLNKYGRDSLNRTKLTFEKVFYGKNESTDKAN